MRTVSVAMLAGTLCIAGCGQKPQPPEATADSVHGLMTKRIDQYADTIWGIGNAALNDDAGIDPARMPPQAWLEMASTATKLADAGQTLGRLQPIQIVHAGERIVDEGKPHAPTGARVQSNINANPALFRTMAASLEQHGRDLAVAARAKDAANTGRLVNEIDGVCETCHLEFWYPEDRKALEAMAKH